MGTIKRHEGKRGIVWRVREEIDRDPATGKRRWKWVIGPTKKEVERQVAAIRAAVVSGTYDQWSHISLAEYLAGWLAIKEGDLRGSSHARTRRDFELHVYPAFGYLPLCDLRAAHVQRLYLKLRDTHATSSIARIHTTLKSALQMAFEQEMIARNPCALVHPPKLEVPEPRVWTPADARLFLTACEDHPWGTYFRVMLFTGMRKGEMLALRWSDLDLDRGTLTVRRTKAVDREQRPTINTPKSASGRRTIKLTPSCIAALRAHRTTQNVARLAAPRWEDNDLVFPRDDGTIWHAARPNIVLKWLIVESGVPPLRVHDLRHTSATLSLGQGVDVRVVQERLGHANSTMTRRYQHPSVAMQEDAAERMERALS